eukprot:1150265-Pelagomonas_calceolata.AAC.1
MPCMGPATRPAPAPKRQVDMPCMGPATRPAPAPKRQVDMPSACTLHVQAPPAELVESLTSAALLGDNQHPSNQSSNASRGGSSKGSRAAGLGGVRGSKVALMVAASIGGTQRRSSKRVLMVGMDCMRCMAEKDKT